MNNKLKIFLTAGILLTLSGCAAIMGLDGDASKQAEAPDYRVGDRWVYHIEEGYRMHLSWDETWEITKIDNNGVTVQITSQGSRLNGIETRTEIWPQPGLVSQGALMNTETRQFNTPYQRYRFPMRAGDSWSQWLDTADKKERYGQQQPNFITRAWGWEKIKSPVGETDALKLNQVIRFDDEDPWRYPTRASYISWYAPEVNNIVRAEKRAGFIEKGDGRSAIEITSQLETVELRSYTRGKQ
ncbi:MAG: hypothetical protein LBB65_01240 [Burkholderiales bacterium]|jgi:uncharacterized protein YceK|nr:hypothetical protein [Burkholderiales bacterium]